MIPEKSMKNLITYFPRAEFASDAYRKCNNILLAQGLHSKNTLFASAICVDEINHYPTSLCN